MCVVPRQEPCPDNTGAKIQNVWESAKKVEEKFGTFRKNCYLCSVKKRISLKGRQPLWLRSRFEPHFYKPSLTFESVASFFVWGICWGTVTQYCTRSWLERCRPTVSLMLSYCITSSFSNCFWFLVFRLAGSSYTSIAYCKILVRRNTARVDS